MTNWLMQLTTGIAVIRLLSTSFQWDSCCSLVFCVIVLFLLAIVLTVFLLFAASDCPLWYFQTFLVLMLERKIFNQNVISNKCIVLIGCFWVMRTKLFIESFMIVRPGLKPSITDVVPRPDTHFGYKVSRHLHVYTYGRDSPSVRNSCPVFPHLIMVVVIYMQEKVADSDNAHQ